MAQITDTPAQTGKKKYKLPSTGLIRAVLLFGTTAYEAGVVNEPQLYVDDKNMNVEYETIQMLARAVFDKKIHAGILSDISPRAEEGINNMWKYYLIDFGEDLDGMLNSVGKKVEIQLNVATAEAIRIIPLILIPV